jgi:hypothetical protein
MMGLRAISLLALLGLGGCTTTTINAYCNLANPLSYSRSGDTRHTIRGIVAHNAVWKSQNCPKK